MSDYKTLIQSFSEIFEEAPQSDLDQNRCWETIANYLRAYDHVLAIYSAGAALVAVVVSLRMCV